MIDTDSKEKVPVETLAYYYREQGELPRPVAIWWEDEKLPVRTSGVRAGVSMKIKRQGIGYNCIIAGRPAQLMYNPDIWTWYIQLRRIKEPETNNRLDEHAEIRYETEYKEYVPVLALFHSDGRAPEPVTIYWGDGRQFNVQHILEVSRAASQEAGGVGIRYTCVINNNHAMIFFDDAAQCWFVVRKEPRKCAAGTI